MKQHTRFIVTMHFRVLCAALLALAATSCQKDDRTVTLNAVIDDSGAKMYINDSYGRWHNGDAVRINGTSYDVTVTSATSATATIVYVNESSNYTAGYPAANTEHKGVRSLEITVPATQVYTMSDMYSSGNEGDTAQYIPTPMAAYCTNSNPTLQFQNVGALLKVTIDNQIAQTMTLYAVEVVSDRAPLSGTLPVTFDEGTGAMSVGTICS